MTFRVMLHRILVLQHLMAYVIMKTRPVLVEIAMTVISVNSFTIIATTAWQMDAIGAQETPYVSMHQTMSFLTPYRSADFPPTIPRRLVRNQTISSGKSFLEECAIFSAEIPKSFIFNLSLATQLTRVKNGCTI